MNDCFRIYEEPLFRPPAEANSLILQVTTGCNWNRCLFCEMYTDKTFRIKSTVEIKQSIQVLKKIHPKIKRIFIADGDCFSIGFNKLFNILQNIKENFPHATRISAYASALNLKNYLPDELAQLRLLGLSLLYVGVESGHPIVLKNMNKGVSAEKQLTQLQKAKIAGFKLSIMILNGLGGQEFSSVHASYSAQFVNLLQPDLLSVLVLSFPLGFNHFYQKLNKPFTPLTTLEGLIELRSFINDCELTSTVFRADHASNYLILKGGLNRDKEKILMLLNSAIEDPSTANLRKEQKRTL